MDQPINTSYDSTQVNPNQGLPQANQASLNQHPGTLYNQDFFVSDTTGRRLSQIPDKFSFSLFTPKWTLSATTETTGPTNLPEDGHLSY